MTMRPPFLATHTTDLDPPSEAAPPLPASSGLRRAPRRHWGGPAVGGFYLTMGGVHIGLVAADTDVYRPFAGAAYFAFVRDGWQNIFMARPAVFGLLLAAAEITLGVLLLRGGRAATAGWAGAVAFHLLLMLFGFGIWLWCLPALAVLTYLARQDRTRAPLEAHFLPGRRHQD